MALRLNTRDRAVQTEGTGGNLSGVDRLNALMGNREEEEGTENQAPLSGLDRLNAMIEGAQTPQPSTNRNAGTQGISNTYREVDTENGRIRTRTTGMNVPSWQEDPDELAGSIRSRSSALQLTRNALSMASAARQATEARMQSAQDTASRFEQAMQNNQEILRSDTSTAEQRRNAARQIEGLKPYYTRARIEAEQAAIDFEKTDSAYQAGRLRLGQMETNLNNMTDRYVRTLGLGEAKAKEADKTAREKREEADSLYRSGLANWEPLRQAESAENDAAKYRGQYSQYLYMTEGAEAANRYLAGEREKEDTDPVSIGRRIINTIGGAALNFADSFASAPFLMMARLMEIPDDIAYAITGDEKFTLNRDSDALRAANPFTPEIQTMQNNAGRFGGQIVGLGGTAGNMISLAGVGGMLSGALGSTGLAADLGALAKSSPLVTSTATRMGAKIGAAVLNEVISNPGNAAISASAGLTGYSEALKNGASFGDAVTNGILKAAAEYFSNKMFSGMPFEDAGEKGYVTKLIEKAAEGLGKSDVLKAFNRSTGGQLLGWLFDKAGEGLEEVITAVLDPFIDYATYNPEGKIDIKLDQLIEEFEGGVLLSLLMSGGEAAIRPAMETAQIRDELIAKGIDPETAKKQAPAIRKYFVALNKMGERVQQAVREDAQETQETQETTETVLQRIVNKYTQGEKLTGQDARRILSDPEAVQALRDSGYLGETPKNDSAGREKVVTAAEKYAEAQAIREDRTEAAPVVQETQETAEPVTAEGTETRPAAAMETESTTTENGPPLPNRTAAREAQGATEGPPLPGKAQETGKQEQAGRLRLGGEAGTPPLPTSRLTLGANNRTGGMNNGQAEAQVRTENGANVPGRSGERGSGLRSGEQTGKLGRSPEGWRTLSRAEKAAARRAHADDVGVQAVSARSLGVNAAAEDSTVRVYPREAWEPDLQRIASRVEKATGKPVTFVLGSMKVNAGGKALTVRGVNTGKGIIVQADDPGISAEKIAAHEAYHSFAAQDPELSARVLAQIRKQFPENRLRQLAETYLDKLYGIVDLNSTDKAVMTKALERVRDEICADAYAGINAFAANADEYTNAARQAVTEARRETAAATERKTGPPERNNLLAESKARQEERTLRAANVNLDDATESANATQFSADTWNESDYVKDRKAAAKDLANRLGISEKKALKFIDDVNGIARMIVADRDRLDYEASPARSSFIGNTEYGGTIDFSTICKKRRLYTGTMEAIQKAMPDQALTAEEMLQIRSMMKDKGYEVSCGLCYVEGSRVRIGKYTLQFLDELKDSGLYVPTMAEMNTVTGQEKIRREHPEVYERYVKFMNKLAQRKPKLFQMATAYNGEILQKFKNDTSVKEKNRHGGLRLQSFSDFEIVHLIDNMQVIMDMARVGLAGQANTKVPDFAWALGNTGLKINLSLIAKGVDENGRIILDEVEGMKRADAEALRNAYSKNVGTILVTFDDAQLKAAMNDPFIDFIIPFHRSQWKKAQYGALGLPSSTRDYTMQQNEKYIQKILSASGKATRPENLQPNDYWDFGKSGKENAETYLKLCAENNRRPKFYKLLVNNGDGSYSLQKDGSTDGYWKLLIDFKMYDNSGKGSPQLPVKPNFNMEQSERMLNEYTGGHQSFPVAHDIVDEFLAGKGISSEDTGGEQYSAAEEDEDYLAAVEAGDMETAQRMADEAARAAGYSTPKLYHGTRFFGFTRFDLDKMDDGTSIFTTDSRDTAETYSGQTSRNRISNRSTLNVDDLHGEDLLDAAKDALGDRYENYQLMSDEEREWYIDDTRDDIDRVQQDAARFVNKNESRFNEETLKYADEMIYAIGSLSVARDRNDDRLWAAWNRFDKTLWDFKFAKESLLLEFLDAMNYKHLQLYKNRLGDLFYDGDLYVDDSASGLRYVFDNQLALEVDSAEHQGIYELFGKPGKQLVIDADGSNWNRIIPPEELNLYGSVTTREITTAAKAMGYDSVLIQNLRDNGGETGYNGTSDIYVFFNANQLKSADPVTYDDDGNVIPLSERFNPAEEDIRYSADVDYDQETTEARIQELQAELERITPSQTERNDLLATSRKDLRAIDKRRRELMLEIDRLQKLEPQVRRVQEELEKRKSIEYQKQLLEEGGFDAVKENEAQIRQLERKLKRLAASNGKKITEKAPAENQQEAQEQEGPEILPESAAEYDHLKKQGKITLKPTQQKAQAAEIVREPVAEQTEETIPKSAAEYGQMKRQGKIKAPKITRPVSKSTATIAKADLRKALLTAYSIPGGSRAEMGKMIDALADQYLKNKRISMKDRENLINKLWENGAMFLDADDGFQAVRDLVRHGRIYVPQSVKNDFGDDWNSFRREAMAEGIYLVNDEAAAGWDQWNAELSDAFPGLFDENEYDPRNFLENVVDLARKGKGEKLSLAEYAAKSAGAEYATEEDMMDNLERQADYALKAFAEKAGLEIYLKDRTGVKIAQERQRMSELMDKAVARERERGDKRVQAAKESGANALAKEKQREEDLRKKEREHRKEVVQRLRERQAMRELQQKTLKQLQWLSRNQNKFPAEAKKQVQELLEDMDVLAVSAAEEMHIDNATGKTWKDLYDMYKEAKENDPNWMPSAQLEKIVMRLDAKKIGDLDIGALRDLYQAAVGLRTELYNRNNLINDELHRTIDEVYESAKEEIQNANGGYRAGAVQQYADMQLTPMNRFLKMAGWNPDSTWYGMAKGLEAGERAQRKFKTESQRQIAPVLEQYRDWMKTADGQGKNAKWYEIKVPESWEYHMGDKPIFSDKTVTVYMTPAQKVHMYLESKNLDNLRHMEGGRTFADKELYSKGKQAEAFANGTIVKLLPETVKNIVSDLTAEEQALADALEQYYNSYSKQEINKVSNILYGYDKAMGGYYAPIFTNDNYTKSEPGIFDLTAEGVGNLKERQHSANPSLNISAFDAFERSVDKTGKFVGLAIPIRNMNTLWNWRESGNSMKDVVSHKWNKPGVDFVGDLMTELQSGREIKHPKIEQLTNAALSKYIGATFGFNPSIVLKQFASFPLAGTYLGYDNLAKGILSPAADTDLISKYTGELDYRLLGYATPETATLKNNPNKLQEKGPLNFALGGGAITWMDGLTVKTLWNGAEQKVKSEQPDLDRGTQAQIDAGQSPFYQAVAKEFEEAVSRSQPMYDTMHRADVMREGDPITRTFTLFKTVPMQELNMLAQTIGEANYYKSIGADKDTQAAARQKAGRAFLGILTGNLMIGVISFLNALLKNGAKAYKDKDGELNAKSIVTGMLKQYAKDAAGLALGGSEAADILSAILFGDKWYGLETPGIEQVGSIIEKTLKAAKKTVDMVKDSVDVLQNGGDWFQYMRDHGGDYVSSVEEIGRMLATYATGLPVDNVKAYLLGAAQHISPAIKTAYEDIMSKADKSGLKGLTGAALEMRTTHIFRDRVGEVSERTVDTISGLYEAGYKDAVPPSVASSYKVNGEDRTLDAADDQLYRQVWRQSVSGTLDELTGDKRFVSMSQADQAKTLGKLYDYAAQSAKAALWPDYTPDKWVSTANDLDKSGIPLSEWLPIRQELSKISGDGKKENIQDYIDSLPYTRDQKKALYTAEGYKDADKVSWHNGARATSRSTTYAPADLGWLEKAPDTKGGSSGTGRTYAPGKLRLGTPERRAPAAGTLRLGGTPQQQTSSRLKLK